MLNQQGREEGSEQGLEGGWQGPVGRWSKQVHLVSIGKSLEMKSGPGL